MGSHVRAPSLQSEHGAWLAEPTNFERFVDIEYVYTLIRDKSSVLGT